MNQTTSPAAPDFAHPVPPGGYAWWYVDALDHEGRFGLAIIGLVGSVFSPYYAWARQRGHADPLNYCAMNVGLYLPGRKYWTMTERGRSSLARSPTQLAIGPSAMHWHGGSLRIEIDEVSAPLPRRVRGTIRLHPQLTCSRDFALEPGGGHRWRPFAPRAEVEVAFDSPAVRWRGTGYFDSNVGDTPLEQAFSRWQWTRAHLPHGRAAINYDAQPRNGRATALTLRMDQDALTVSDAPRAMTPLKRTGWGLERAVAVDPETQPRVVRVFEDGPFYGRSLLAASLHGTEVLAVHETLSLDRFAAGWVRALLPFRMPRMAGAAQG